MKLPTLSLRAALFDLDGTLVRTFIDFPAMRQVMRELSAHYGTTSATETTEDILGIVEQMAQALGGDAGAEAKKTAYEILTVMEIEGCAHPEPITGATELLTNLRDRGVRVGIITRNSRQTADDLIRRMSLPCDRLVAREDTHEFKPHPEPLLTALRDFALPPENAVMVGDLWADIAAGRAAGVALTVGIQWPHDPPQRFARCPPDREVASLKELFPLLLQ